MIFNLQPIKLSASIPGAQNNLFGTLPCYFNNFKTMATKQKSELVLFIDTMQSAFLVTKGKENQRGSILCLIIFHDLSSNNFSSWIPEQLISLQGLFSLSLSRNHLLGIIPYKIGNIIRMESLDLSRNKLSRKIPLSICKLNFLNHLNLSNNL